MDYSENKDISAMCEVYKAEVEALRKALKEQGDWADKGEKVNVNTDRTESTIQLVEKIEELNGWLDLKTEYISSLEKRILEMVDILKECRLFVDLCKDTPENKLLLERIDKQIGHDDAE